MKQIFAVATLALLAIVAWSVWSINRRQELAAEAARHAAEVAEQARKAELAREAINSCLYLAIDGHFDGHDVTAEAMKRTNLKYTPDIPAEVKSCLQIPGMDANAFRRARADYLSKQAKKRARQKAEEAMYRRAEERARRDGCAADPSSPFCN